MAEKELQGVVSLDLRREPDFDFDPRNAELAARALDVRDEDGYTIAARMIQESAACIAKVEEFWEEDKKLAHRLHKSITDKIAKFTAPFRGIRPLLEPKMREFRRRQEEARRMEELRLQREREKAEHEARMEAERIRREAEEAARKLQEEGRMREAARVQQEAADQAMVVESAPANDVDLLVPANIPRVAGLAESRPWIGRVTDPMQIIRAVAEGRIPLMYTIPVRGRGPTEVPLLEVNMAVLTELAKRLGREDIGVPGAVGERDFGFRVSKSAAPIPANQPVGSREPW